MPKYIGAHVSKKNNSSEKLLLLLSKINHAANSKAGIRMRRKAGGDNACHLHQAVRVAAKAKRGRKGNRQQYVHLIQ